MKGVLLNNRGDIGVIIEAIKDTCKKYQWLVSYYESTKYPKEMPFDRDYVLLDGETLVALFEREVWQFQIIDGVFSAIPKGILEEKIVKCGLPDAKKEGGTNNFFGVEERKITHPLAEIEICSFDSTYVTFLAKDESLEERVAKAFADDIIDDIK